ncbi:MAG: chromate transporter [Solirubrobacteraceae bacterium]
MDRVAGERRRVPLRRIAQAWLRIGITGFGGPPAHIALLHRLVVEHEDWMSEHEFEASLTACNLLPGPASTQLSILCARQLAGTAGAIVGGLAFVLPAVVLVLALSGLFLAASPPRWIRGAGAGAGSAVAAVAASAGWALARPSLARAAGIGRDRVRRWVAYVAVGAVSAALIGPYLVLVLVACGGLETGIRQRSRRSRSGPAGGAINVHAWPALLWVALKVGALSFGGGFVIIPLMQADVVHAYHWMSSTQFLNAVALGQVTPGPVVATVAAVGYAARGITGGIVMAVVAFAPSFLLVVMGGGRFASLRRDSLAGAFLDGAGPAAIGAILGAAIPLAGALRETWQVVVLAAVAVAMLLLHRGVVQVLVAAGLLGAVIALAGGPLPR